VSTENVVCCAERAAAASDRNNTRLTVFVILKIKPQKLNRAVTVRFRIPPADVGTPYVSEFTTVP